LIYSPGIIIVGQYFSKKRSIATGFSTAGSGMGAFMFPPIIEFLFYYYGYVGTMLLLGGIMFNNIVIGALYRPLVEKVKFNKDKLKDIENCNYTQTDVSCCQHVCQSLQKHLDLSLWKDSAFVFFATALGLVTMSYIGLQMMMADMSLLRGLSDKEAVILLSTIGVSDTCGRVLTGFVFSAPHVRSIRGYLYNLSLFVMALTCFSLAVGKNFWVLFTLCLAHGLATSVITSQRAVMAIDLLGMAKLPSSFGLTLFIQGTAILIGPAFAGEFVQYIKAHVFV
jgi:hypothetical protein